MAQEAVSLEDRHVWRKNFVAHHEGPQTVLTPLPSDCSQRRYFRLTFPDVWPQRPSRILMDAPPPHEAIGPFVAVAQLLRALGLRVPEIFAAQPEQGFLILEDFGELTYRRALKHNRPASFLYHQAVDALVHLHQQSLRMPPPPLECMTVPRLLKQVGVFLDWGMPYGGLCLTASEREEALHIWTQMLAPLQRGLSPVIVLRDFHVDNLMHVGDVDATGLMACGLLDFQDAQWGSPAYDLVSLLQDVRHHVDETLQAELKNRYVKKMGFDPLDFDREYQILGLQRAAHIYGIFAKYLVGGTRHHLQAYLPRAAYLMRSSLVFSWAGPWKTYLEKLDSRLETGTNLSTTLHIL